MAEQTRGRFTIGKSVCFSAAHLLVGPGPGHKCARLHPHTCDAELLLVAGELTGLGFGTDFGDLAPFDWLLGENVDRRFLNAVLPCEPASELLSQYLAELCVANVEPEIPGRLTAIRVSETPTSRATFQICEAGGA